MLHWALSCCAVRQQSCPPGQDCRRDAAKTRRHCPAQRRIGHHGTSDASVRGVSRSPPLAFF